MSFFFLFFARLYPASGQKLIVVNKKGSGLTNKSQTLPRSMGSRVPALSDGRPQRLPTKPATTPPVIRRQFSVTIRTAIRNCVLRN